MENIKPNDQRAKIAIIMLWIMLAIEVISLGSNYLQYDLLQQYNSGASLYDIDYDTNDLRQGIIAIAYVIAYIICAVTFIQWFRRAYFNLHTRVNDLFHSEGWAAGAWFVPILNLFRPYQIMKELYDETDILLNRKLHSYRNRLSANVIGLWWGFWIVNNIVGQVAFRLPANTMEELSTSTMVEMGSSLISIPLALLAIKVVSDYSKVEPLITEVNNEVDEFGSSSLNPQVI